MAVFFYCSKEDLSQIKIRDSCGDFMGEFLDWYDLREVDAEELDWMAEQKYAEMAEELKYLREENRKLEKKIRKMKYKLYGKS